MNLSWYDADPNTLRTTSQHQSDSNWDTSVFIYKSTSDCADCISDVVTLNFRFEVSDIDSYLYNS